MTNSETGERRRPLGMTNSETGDGRHTSGMGGIYTQVYLRMGGIYTTGVPQGVYTVGIPQGVYTGVYPGCVEELSLGYTQGV